MIRTRIRQTFLAVLGITLAVLIASCSSEAANIPSTSRTSASTTPAPNSYVTTEPHDGLTSLRCEECRAVEVVEVIGPETVQTPEGPIRLYGAFVAPEEENCVEQATARLTELVSNAVRLETSTRETDSSGTPIRYMYTESGDSIDEIFVSEGLARSGAFEGIHSPWLLITADKARRDRTGCIWENFDRMFPQRTPRPPGSIN